MQAPMKDIVIQHRSPSPQRWRVARRIYAFVVGGVLAVLALLLMRSGLSDGLQVLLAGALGGFAVVLVLISFRLSRATSMERIGDLHARVEEAIRNGARPNIEVTGWSAFDALGDATLRLSIQYEERLQAILRERDDFCRLAEDAVGLDAYFGPRGRLLWVSPSIERITGRTREECLDAPDLTELWVYAKDHAMMRDLARRSLQGEAREDHELRIQHRDGTLTWYSCRWHPRRGPADEILGVRFSAQNIQRRKDAEFKLLETVAALRRAQALKDHYLNRSNEERMRLAALLDIVALGIVFIDRDRRVVYINQPALDIWQLGDRDMVVGMRDEVLIDQTIRLRVDDEGFRAHLEGVLADRGRSRPYDIPMLDGRIIREISAVVLSPEGERAIGRVWIYEDVTEERQAAKRLTDLAERDPLTGLYNRRRFMEELERQIFDTGRRREQLGLLSFDLDGFKAINDTYGHQAGDEVLISLASEVGGVVRRNEMLFRLGGDEFALLVANTDEERMVQLATRVLARIRELKFTFEGQSAVVTVSLGIALSPLHAEDRGELIAQADRAMYSAKLHGKNRWEVAGGQSTESRLE